MCPDNPSKDTDKQKNFCFQPTQGTTHRQEVVIPEQNMVSMEKELGLKHSESIVHTQTSRTAHWRPIIVGPELRMSIATLRTKVLDSA